MRHPFQCIALVSSSPAGEDILLAACGPTLSVLGLSSGGTLSNWPSANILNNSSTNGGDDGRPAKKQKTEGNILDSPTIIKLAASPDGRYAIIVTDDKVIRVLQIGIDGRLQESSQRCMPKRPCAIDVLPDSSTILCGDKFGDVYSLPMIPGSDAAVKNSLDEPNPQEIAETNFKPAANNLTVHTQKNRRALEAQILQKSFTAKKEPLAFEHKLLLGHVSMLTDVKHAVQKVGSKRRGFVLTADRDEHIRVSRGPPQSYVIEGFCLGHDEFVSKLCLVSGTNLLISGGGDDWLGVWDWTQYKLLRRRPLMPLLGLLGSPVASDFQFAVSGLWASYGTESLLAVAVERIAALFIVPLSSLSESYEGSEDALTDCSAIQLDGCPIDVIWTGNKLIVSQDARSEGSQRLLGFQFDGFSGEKPVTSAPKFQRLGIDDALVKALHALDSVSGQAIASLKELDDLLYSVNNLRKRHNRVAGAEDLEDAGVAEEIED